MDELKSLERKNKSFKKQIKKIEAEIQKRTKLNKSLSTAQQHSIQIDAQKENAFDRIFDNLMQKRDGHIRLCSNSQAMFSAQIDQLKQSIVRSGPSSSKRMKLSNTIKNVTNECRPVMAELESMDRATLAIRDSLKSMNRVESFRTNMNQTRTVSSNSNRVGLKSRNDLNATFVTQSSLGRNKSVNLNAEMKDEKSSHENNNQYSVDRCDQDKPNLNETRTISKSKSSAKLNCTVKINSTLKLSSTVTKSRSETNLNKVISKSRTKNESSKAIIKPQTKSETMLRKSLAKNKAPSNSKETKIDQNESTGCKNKLSSNLTKSISGSSTCNATFVAKSSLLSNKLTNKSIKSTNKSGCELISKGNESNDVEMMDVTPVDRQSTDLINKNNIIQQDADKQDNTHLNVTNLLLKMPNDSMFQNTPTTKYNLRSSVRSVKKNYVY